MAQADVEKLKQDLNRRMDGAMDTLKREFNGLRTGRAHPGLLEPVKVQAYGSEMPLTQCGTVGAPEPRMLTVQVWDRSLVGAVEKAIRDIAAGRLPRSPEARTWGGRGCGRRCAVCDQPITSEESEMEAEVSGGGDDPVFHVGCHFVWLEACREWIRNPPHAPRDSNHAH